MCSVKIVPQNSGIFQSIKQIPFLNVAQRYLPQLKKTGTHWVVCCPFHDDRRPSLVIYTNGFHCFSCQAHGDGVNLVARLYGLRPFEAARMLCQDFGLPVSGDTPHDRQAARRRVVYAQRERQQREAQRQAERAAYEHLSALFRALDRSLAAIRTKDDLEAVGGLYHISVILEHILETLRCGNQEEKRQALTEARRWGA